MEPSELTVCILILPFWVILKLCIFPDPQKESRLNRSRDCRTVVRNALKEATAVGTRRRRLKNWVGWSEPGAFGGEWEVA